ncbi:MAG: beta strand repeat-containing protein [Halarcobacter sp.]
MSKSFSDFRFFKRIKELTQKKLKAKELKKSISFNKNRFTINPLESRLLLSANPIVGATVDYLSEENNNIVYVQENNQDKPSANIKTNQNQTLVIGDSTSVSSDALHLTSSQIKNLKDSANSLVIGDENSGSIIEIGDKSSEQGDINIDVSLTINNPNLGGEMYIYDNLIGGEGTSLSIYGSGHTLNFGSGGSDTAISLADDVLISDSIVVTSNDSITAGTDGTGNITLGASTTHRLDGNAGTTDTLNLNANGGSIVVNSTVGYTDQLEGLSILDTSDNSEGAENVTFKGEVNVDGDIYIYATGTVTFNQQLTLSGNLTIIGADLVVFEDGVSAGGDILIEGNEINFKGGEESITSTGAGTLTLRPTNTSYDMSISSPPLETTANTLNITATEMGTLTDGFSKIIFGHKDIDNHTKSTAVGEVRVGVIASNQLTFKDNVEIYGGSIKIEDYSNEYNKLIASGDITLDAINNITISNYIEAQSSDITLYSQSGKISQINDSTDGLTSEELVSNTLTVSSQTGIDLMFTKVTTLDAQNLGTGNIKINELASGGDIVVNRLSQSATGGTTSLTTQNGNITIASGQNGVSNAGSGSLTIQAKDTGIDTVVNVNETITSAGENVNLKADGNININANITHTYAAGAINITSYNDSIVMADATSASSTNGIINYTANDNIKLSLVSTAANVNLSATSGNISDNLSAETANVIADVLTINSNTGVGTSVDDINTTVSNIDITNATSGDIYVKETDTLTIDAITQTLAGNISVVATLGDITQDGDINSTSGTITLSSIAGSIIMNNDTLTKSSNSADITLNAANNIKLSLVSTTANVNLSATNGYISDNLSAETANVIADVLTINSNTGVGTSVDDINTTVSNIDITNATSGDIYVKETDTLTIDAITQSSNLGVVNIVSSLGDITQDGAISSVAGNIDVVSSAGSIIMNSGKNTTSTSGVVTYTANTNVALSVIDTSSNVNITATNGNISDNLDTEDANIKGTTTVVSLVAATGIGASGDADIDTTIASLTASNTTSGDIFIQESDDLSITSLSALGTTGNAVVSTINGAITAGTITANNNILLTTEDVANDEAFDITLNGIVTSNNGNISIVSDNDVLVNANIIASTATKTIQVIALNDITMADGTQIATTNSGNILLDAGNDVNIESINAGTGSVSITALGNLVDTDAIDTTNSDVDIQASSLLLDITGFIGTATNHIETTVTTLSAKGAGLFVSESDGLSIDSVSVDVNGVNSDGSITATANSAQENLVSTDKLILVSASGDIDVTSNATVSSNGDTLLKADNITLSSALSSTSGALSIITGGTFAQNANITTVGTVDVQANAISMASTSKTDATAANVRYASTTTLSLGQIVTTSDVSLLASSISDANANTNNITADELKLTVSGSTATTLDYIETDISTLSSNGGSLFITQAGNLTINETSAISVTTINTDASTTNTEDALQSNISSSGEVAITSTTGSITITDGKNIIAQDDITLNAANNIKLSLVSTTANVNLSATNGYISDNLSAETANVIADVLTINSNTGVGTSVDDINTTVSNIDITNATSGDIYVKETDTLTIDAITQSSNLGVVNIVSSLGDITQDGAISSVAGNIDVVSSAGSIIMNSGKNTTSTSGVVTYTANTNVALSVIDTSSNVNITATNGNISDNLDTEDANIKGTTTVVSLVAATGIGASGDADIDTTIASLTASNTTSGDIFIQESDDLSITSLSALGTTGNAVVSTINGAITAGTITANNNILLTTEDVANDEAFDITLNGIVTSNNGNISIVSDNDVLVNANIIASTATKTIQVIALNDITMADGTQIATTNSGNILLDAGNDVNIESINAGTGSVSITALGNLVDTDAIDTTNSDVDIQASSLLLDITGFIGTATNHIETTVTTLSAKGAGLFVSESDGLSIDSVSVDVNGVNSDGSITATANSAQENLVSTDKLILVSASGDIDVTSNATVSSNGDTLLKADNITLSSALSSTSGALSIITGGTFAQNANITTVGTVDVQANAISMASTSKTDATAANVRYASTTTLSLGQIVTTSDVSLLATTITNNLISTAPFNNVKADELKITASTLGTNASNLKTDLATLSANVSGDVFVKEANAVNIGQTSAITVTTIGTDASTSNTIDALQTKLSSLGNLVLQASGVITTLDITGNIEASGNILVKSATNITSNAQILSTGGNITLDASANININDNVTTQTANKTIDIFSTAGNVIMSDASQVSTSDSNIRVKAKDFSISSLNAGTANVSLFLTGVFSDSGDTNTDITANKLRVYLSGAGVVGANTQNIETSINVLSAVVNKNGLYLDNSKDILIDNVEAISVNKVGTNGLTTARTDDAQDSINSTGTVSLIANGSILDRADNSVSIISDKLILDATNGIGTQANNLNTTVSNIDITNATSGDIYVKETDTLTIDAITQSSNLGVVNIVSTLGDITQDGAISSVAGNIDVVSSAGSIIMNSGKNTTSTNGVVTYTANTNVALSVIDTSSNVNITATNGNISDNLSAETANVIADVLTINSNTGVGTSVDDINTTVSNIDITNATSGDIYVKETDTLTIDAITQSSNLGVVNIVSTLGDITQDGAISSVAGNIDVVSSAGSIIMNSGKNTTSTNGVVTYTANTNVALSVIDTSSNVNITATNGNISDNLSAETANVIADVLTINSNTGVGTSVDDINTTVSNIDITNATSGDIYVKETDTLTIDAITQSSNLGVVNIVSTLGDITQDGAISSVAGNIDVVSSAGSIIMNSGKNTTSTNGVVTYTANTNVALSVIDTSSNVNITATNGNISDNLSAETANVIADVLTINSNTGVGTSVDDINTTVSNIDITNATSGDIYVKETDTLTIDAITQSSNLGVVNIVSSLGDITQDGAISSVAGNIDVVSSAGSIIMNSGKNTTSTSGVVTYTANTNVALSVIDTSSNVNITATNGNISDNLSAETANVIADVLTINSNTGVGTSVDDINTTVSNIDITNATSGDIYVKETDTLTIDAITQSSNLGVVNIVSSLGDITQDGAISSVAGNIDVVSSAGSIIMNSGKNTTSTSGVVTYTANTNVALSVIDTSSNVNITATNGNISDNLDTEDANIKGTTTVVSLVAATGIGANGDADIDTTIASLTASNTTSGDIFIQESDDLILDSITTSGNVDITASNLTNTATSLLSSSLLSLDVTSADINTKVSTLTATASGDVTINESDDLILDSITTSGNVDITASNLTNTATSLLSSSLLSLDVTSADINTKVSTLTATASGDVTINESDDLILDSITTSGNVDITASNLTNTATSLLSSSLLSLDVTSADINTKVSTLTATASGDVTINESDDLILDSITTSGNVDITASNLTNTATSLLSSSLLSLDVTSADINTKVSTLTATASGDVTINESDDLILDSITTSGNVDITASNLTNTATSLLSSSLLSLDVTSADINTKVSTLTATASGDVTINESDDLILDSITTSGNVDITASNLTNTATSLLSSSLLSLDVTSADINTKVSTLTATASGDVTINESDDLILDSITTSGNVDITASNLTNTATSLLSSSLLSLDVTSADINTKVSTLTATASGDVTINESDDLILDSITTSGNVDITASNLTNTATSLLSSSLLSLDVTSADINTKVSTLTATASGDVTINESDDLILDSITTSGNVDITASNLTNTATSLLSSSLLSLDVTSADINTKVSTLTATASGDVTINESDDLILDSITTSGNVDITASNLTNTATSLLSSSLLSLDVTSADINTKVSTLTATASGDVTINESDDLILDSMTTDGNVTISANNITNNTTLVADKLSLDVTTASLDTDIAVLKAIASGDVSINELDYLVVEDVQTSSNVTIQTQDSMKIGTISANTVTLKTQDGRITDYYNNQNTNITAQNLNMVGKGAFTKGEYLLNSTSLNNLSNNAINTDVRNLFIANKQEAKIDSKIGSSTSVFLVEKDNYSLQVVNKTIVTPKLSQIETTMDLTNSYSAVEQWSFAKEIDYELLNSSYVMKTHHVQAQENIQTRVTSLFESINNPTYVNHTSNVVNTQTVQTSITDVLNPISLNYSNYTSNFNENLIIDRIDSELFEYWIEDIAL